MSLSQNDIKKIAHLARLHIEEQEMEYYREGLSRILGMIDQMNEVDTRGVEPLYHPNDVPLRLRPDDARGDIDRSRLQDSAPRSEHGLYLVPRVVE